MENLRFHRLTSCAFLLTSCSMPPMVGIVTFVGFHATG